MIYRHRSENADNLKNKKTTKRCIQHLSLCRRIVLVGFWGSALKGLTHFSPVLRLIWLFDLDSKLNDWFLYEMQ